MAFDAAQADQFRADLALIPGITEKRMFGGLCFLLNGNMLCGVHNRGAMYRVGKDHHSEALAIEGASELAFTGKPMGGFVDIDLDAFWEDDKRKHWLGFALDFVGSLPPK